MSIDLIREFIRLSHGIDNPEMVQQEVNRQSTMELMVREQARTKARSLEQIALAVGVEKAKLDKAKAVEEVKKLMRTNEHDFVHWTHHEEPTRYALKEHVEGLDGWKPGLDF